MKILALVIGVIIMMIIADLIPVSLVVLLIRIIFKRKLSKGWCIMAFLLSTFTSYCIGYLLIGKTAHLGFLDYAIHFTIIALFLYDKDAPSYFDTEKEIKRKRELQKKPMNDNSPKVD